MEHRGVAPAVTSIVPDGEPLNCGLTVAVTCNVVSSPKVTVGADNIIDVVVDAWATVRSDGSDVDPVKSASPWYSPVTTYGVDYAPRACWAPMQLPVPLLRVMSHTVVESSATTATTPVGVPED
jgi:hypothetical protein